MIFLNSFADDTDAQTIRRSSRATKGSGGQIAQLQIIERIQSERISSKTSHASQLDTATANEPLNPMAPRRPKPRVKHSSVSVPDADVRSDVGLVIMGSIADNQIRPANAHRSLRGLTERPHPHIKQLWKILVMDFILKPQEIKISILLPPFLYLPDLMELLLRLLVEGPLPRLLVEGPLPRLLVEGPLPWLLVEGPLPRLLVEGPLPRLLVAGLLPRLLVAGLLPRLLVAGPLPRLPVAGLLPRLLVDLWPLFLVLCRFPGEVLRLQVHARYPV